MTVINNADAVYLGRTAVDRVYLGSELLWLAFRPVELFANSEQGAWYDPSDLSTLFQDAAGTVPVTADGDPVGRMLDKSRNGNHASQTVSGSRPIYRTDGTLHWLLADGVDDKMVLAALTIPSGGALRFTSFAITTTEPGKSKIISFGSGGVGEPWRIGTDTDGTVRVETQGDNVIGTTPINDGLPHIVTVYNTGSNLSTAVIRIDGVVDAISSPGLSEINTNPAGEAMLFTKEGGTEEIAGGLRGLVHVLPSQVLSEVDINAVEFYLASLSGVTL